MGDIADRVRKLQAKADSTTFPAEREALLAKIGELRLRLPPEPERVAEPIPITSRTARRSPAPPTGCPPSVVVVINGEMFTAGRLWGPGGNVSATGATQASATSWVSAGFWTEP